MKILVVEDEVNIRKGMIQLIEECTQHQVVGEASDGEMGLEKVWQLKPDLVITDVRMPQMDGLEMIRCLKERGFSGRTIILSGYSEFEYARKAIIYGVEEYLVKPLTAGQILETLHRVSQAVHEEQLKSDQTSGEALAAFMNHEFTDSQRQKYKTEIFQFEEGHGGVLLAAYLGDVLEKDLGYLQRVCDTFAAMGENTYIYGFYQGNSKIYYCLLTGKADFIALLEVIYKRLVRGWEGHEIHPLWAFCPVENSSKLEMAGDEVRRLLSLGITTPGRAGWYCGEWEEKQRWEKHQFPGRLFQELKNHIYSKDGETISGSLERVLAYYREHKLREADIRQDGVRLCYMIGDVLQEIDRDMYACFRSENILHRVQFAMSWKELEKAYRDMEKIFQQNYRVKKENISNYTISRALAYMEAHYQEKLTQEELAGYLDITPEYLSMLFKREVKKSFSGYIKEIRMKQAKSLLMTTDLKIYEIAKQVGFQDVKYFNRVFKEETGLSPGDFRQL